MDTILSHYRVQGLLHVRYKERLWERPLRGYGHRAATERLEWDAQVTVGVDQEAMAAVVRQLGWRMYVTTQPPEQLSLQEAVLAYRSAYLVERAMGRLKGRPLLLTPMYLEREYHALCPYRCPSGGRKLVIMVFYGIYLSHPVRLGRRESAIPRGVRSPPWI